MSRQSSWNALTSFAKVVLVNSPSIFPGDFQANAKDCNTIYWLDCINNLAITLHSFLPTQALTLIIKEFIFRKNLFVTIVPSKLYVKLTKYFYLISKEDLLSQRGFKAQSFSKSIASHGFIITLQQKYILRTT